MKVMIVDDNEILRRALGKMLLDTGYEGEIIYASTSKEALDLYRRQHPDVIFTDYLMPQETGLELAQHIRENEGDRDVPIYLVSGYLDQLTIQDCLPYFSGHYVKRSISGETAISLIRQRQVFLESVGVTA